MSNPLVVIKGALGIDSLVTWLAGVLLPAAIVSGVVGGTAGSWRGGATAREVVGRERASAPASPAATPGSPREGDGPGAPEVAALPPEEAAPEKKSEKKKPSREALKKRCIKTANECDYECRIAEPSCWPSCGGHTNAACDAQCRAAKNSCQNMCQVKLQRCFDKLPPG